MSKMTSYFSLPTTRLNEKDEEAKILSYQKACESLFEERKSEWGYQEFLYPRAVKLVLEMSAAQDRIRFSQRNTAIIDAFIADVIENIISPIEVEENMLFQRGHKRQLH